MKIDRPKRGRHAAKRLDLSDIKHVLRDPRQWSALGLVVAPSDGSAHWRFETNDDGTAIDVLVEVVTQPDNVPLTCRLAAGMWLVPDIGEEVAIFIPSGRIDFMPTIMGILSSNDVPDPNGGQAPQPDRIVIARSEVMVHNGGAVERMIKADTYRTAEDTLFSALNTFVTAVNTFTTAMHGDAALIAVAPTTTTAAGVLQAAAAVMETAISTFQSGAASYKTTVLKAE